MTAVFRHLCTFIFIAFFGARAFSAPFEGVPCYRVLTNLTSSNSELNNPVRVLELSVKEAARLRALPLEQREKVAVPFFNQQVPRVLEILNQIPSHTYAQPYHVTNSKMERIHPEIGTVGAAIDYFKAEGQKRIEMQNANLEWFPEFALDIVYLRRMALGNIPAITKEKVKQLGNSVARSNPRSRRYGDVGSFAVDRNPLESMLGSPEVVTFNILEDAKTKLVRQRARGTIHWPTFAPLRAEHFRKWDMDIKPLGIVEDIYISFDGNAKVEAAGVYSHDITNHDLPESFLPYVANFAGARNKILAAMDAQSAIDKEILTYIYFLFTHEQPIIYRAYVSFKEGKPRDKVIDELVQYYFEGSTLFRRLTSGADLAQETSPAVKALSEAELSAKIKENLSRLPVILKESF